MDPEREDFDDPDEWHPPPRWMIDLLLRILLAAGLFVGGRHLYQLVVGR